MRRRHPFFLARNVLMAFACSAPVASADPPGPTDVTTASPVSIPASREQDQALSKFRAFTESWMDGLRRAKALQAVAARSGAYAITRFSIAYTQEVKPTGSVSNPYVGILRYAEEHYQCRDFAGTDCVALDSTPVTEIFRYQNGVWVY